MYIIYIYIESFHGIREPIYNCSVHHLVDPPWGFHLFQVGRAIVHMLHRKPTMWCPPSQL